MNPHNPHHPSNPTPAQQPAKKQGLMRSLGQFTGHVFGGLKATATPATPTTQTAQTHKSVEEQTTTDDQGRSVTLRRTTIEEVEYKDR